MPSTCTIITLNFLCRLSTKGEASRLSKVKCYRSFIPLENKGLKQLVDVGCTLSGGTLMSATELRGGICTVLVGPLVQLYCARIDLQY